MSNSRIGAASTQESQYGKVQAVLESKWRGKELKAESMMREIADALWDAFANNPYSWCGFYLLSSFGEEMILGPHRNKPACSPLAMHGVCGKVARTRKAMLVPDVKALGDGHIECDPRNLSEIALPVFSKDGKVWAVFDVDSASLDAFNETYQRCLERILEHFRKTSGCAPARPAPL